MDMKSKKILRNKHMFWYTSGIGTVELASWEIPSFTVVHVLHSSTFFEASITLTKTANFGRKLVSLF